MTNEKAIEKLAGIIDTHSYHIRRVNDLATSILSEIQRDPMAYVKPKELLWDWIGTTHAFAGGNEVLLTAFTAPEDRKMWRLRLKGLLDYTWYEEGELDLAIAAANAHHQEMTGRLF